MSAPANVRKSFSLLELVVVIVIIGIIAAMAIPRVTRGSTGAEGATLRGNLATLRAAIHLYAAEHEGAFPGYHKADGSQQADGKVEDFYAQLLGCSSVTGATGPCAAPHLFGPYLREIPALNVGKNAAEKANEVEFKTEIPLDEHEGNHKGWIYNPRTGEIIANTKAQDPDGTPYKEY